MAAYTHIKTALRFLSFYTAQLNSFLPTLQSTVTVDKCVLDLHELMSELPDYADQFLNMICNILRGYRDTCNSAYRGNVSVAPAFSKVSRRS